MHAGESAAETRRSYEEACALKVGDVLSITVGREQWRGYIISLSEQEQCVQPTDADPDPDEKLTAQMNWFDGSASLDIILAGKQNLVF